MSVGDGVFQADESGAESSDNNGISYSRIQLNDLRLVRLNLNDVVLYKNAQDSFPLTITSEVAIGRTLLHLFEVNSICAFCLYCCDVSCSSLLGDSAVLLFVRVVSKSCLVNLRNFQVNPSLPTSGS